MSLLLLLVQAAAVDAEIVVYLSDAPVLIQSFMSDAPQLAPSFTSDAPVWES